MLDSPEPENIRINTQYFPPTPMESSPSSSSPIEPSAIEVPVEILRQMSQHKPNISKERTVMQVPQYGPHASILLYEWSTLAEHIDHKKALSVDMQDLSIANVVAVSR